MKQTFLLLFLTIVILSPVKAQNLINFNDFQYINVDGIWKFKDPTCEKYYNICTDYISVKYETTSTQKTQFETLHELSRLSEEIAGWYTYKINRSISDIFTFAQTMQNANEVAIVEIATYGEYHTGPPNDTQFANQWYLENGADHDIDILNAWDLTTGSNLVRVGVIDGGMHWGVNDLGIGADNYQNIYLNTQDPWTYPNDPTSGNQADDGDPLTMADDYKGWHFDDVNWSQNNDTRSGNSHGTRVASIIAGKTNNGTGMAGIAGGWNGEGVKIIGAIINNENVSDTYNFNKPISALIPLAIDYCVQHGVKVINISFEAGYSLQTNSAIDDAWSQGVTIVCSAGNDGSPNVVYPANHPKTIAVSATNSNDNLWNVGWGASSYGIHLDVAAPGTGITAMNANGTVGQYDGSSYAAPVVTGIVALMLSVNPCLSPEQIRQILRATAEKVGGYDYDWNYQQPGRSMEFGYGRVNAYQAVLAAQNLYTTNTDLYVRDHYLDYGPDACYPFTWDFDESPDIWVRNSDDGEVNQTHEDYIHFYNSNGSASDKYVYVRVTNSGCTPSSGTETLMLNATAAGTSSAWPNGWIDFGSGQLIGTEIIPIIQPGESAIVKVLWNLMYNTNCCVLARIENEPNDLIGTLPSDISLSIWGQNNIALRNVLIYNFGPMIQPPYFDEFEMPHGNEISFTNPGTTTENFDFSIITEDNAAGNFLTNEAEVTLTFNTESWSLFQSKLENNPNVRVVGDKTVKLLQDFSLEGIEIAPGSIYKCFLGVSFLTEQIQEEEIYEINFVQKYSIPDSLVGDHWTGGLHFKIIRNDRALFLANAGPDQLIDLGETTSLNATDIGEDATYNWYIFEGEQIASDLSVNISPEETTIYQLEVITSDGFKDYDEVTVVVNKFNLSSIVPNPASNSTTIEYVATNAINARLDIVGVNNNNFSSVPLDPNLQTTTVDLTQLPSGIYSVVLICNNEIQDVMQLSVN